MTSPPEPVGSATPPAAESVSPDPTPEPVSPAASAAEPISPAASEPAADPDGDESVLPQGLWQKMRADPQYAPEHLALEAVRLLGPQADRWARETRVRYPGIDPNGLAHLATKKFVNLARLSGAVSGTTGLPGAIVDMGVLAWTQARMVLHIAAAYGADPTAPDRAIDLLVLQKVHKYAEGARRALGVAAGRESLKPLLARSGKADLGRALGQLSLKLAQMAGMKAAKKLFAKMVPGAAVILGTWANSSATTDLAKRTVALYGKHHHHGHHSHRQLPG